MRRRRKKREEEEADVNITPLIDIVFIMLIFFIVTATFIKETGVDVDKPDAQTAVRKERASILIALTEDGEVWMDRRQIDIRAVRANVERMLAESPQAGVVIQADKESRNGLLVRVLDAVNMAGVEDVAISARVES